MRLIINCSKHEWAIEIKEFGKIEALPKFYQKDDPKCQILDFKIHSIEGISPSYHEEMAGMKKIIPSLITCLRGESHCVLQFFGSILQSFAEICTQIFVLEKNTRYRALSH